MRLVRNGEDKLSTDVSLLTHASKILLSKTKKKQFFKLLGRDGMIGTALMWRFPKNGNLEMTL